jgi:hypothetical protein
VNVAETSLVKTLPAVTDVLGPGLRQALIVPLAEGLTGYIVNRPADTLDRSTHRRVYSALVPVTTSSFAADMTTYWAQRSKEGYLERLAEFILVADADGTMVGWTGFHILPYEDRTLVYIDSTGMVAQRQSRGVMRRLMRSRVADSMLPRCQDDLPVYLTARSESPVFYRLMRGLLDGCELFPHPTLAPPPEIVACATLLADWLGQSTLLNPNTLAVEGAYQALDMLYGELPTTGDPHLDTLFRGRLGPLDAYLLVTRAR